ncbi:hypothetical protein NC651_017174 [Populus alba x Populus x berolinensis]|nr:hypothetical protein NC651_017174 [Populus alba x Populus x berolinensis]
MRLGLETLLPKLEVLHIQDASVLVEYCGAERAWAVMHFMAVARQIIDRETIKSTFSRPRGNPASTRRCDGLLGELGANCFHGFCADPFLFATAPISRIRYDHWCPSYVEDISCVNFEIAAASWKTSRTMSATRLRETITECLADVQSDSVDAQRKALRTLASLTKLSDARQKQGQVWGGRYRPVAVRSGAVQVLIGVVESKDGRDLAGTFLAVLGCVRDALRLPEFSSVLADISVRGSSKAREKANQLLKKMVDANLDPYTDGNSLFLPWYQ